MHDQNSNAVGNDVSQLKGSAVEFFFFSSLVLSLRGVEGFLTHVATFFTMKTQFKFFLE